MRFRNSCNYFGLVTDARRGMPSECCYWQGFSRLSCIGLGTPKTPWRHRLGCPSLGEVWREVAPLSPSSARLWYKLPVTESTIVGTPRHELIRAIGRWSLVALVVNSIIGSGVFGLPSTVAGLIGNYSPYAVLGAGAGMSVIIGCFA